MNPEIQAFLLAEYQCLRNEIDSTMKDMRTFAMYSIIATGAIWAWLLTGNANDMFHILRFLPSVIVLILYVYIKVIIRDIHMIGSYISKIEALFALPDGLGWETQLKCIRWAKKRIWLEHVYWFLIFAANVVTAICLKSN
jgi:hypothetical protein